jgi:DNA-binding LacI/PurR family transcriptional regulator
MKQQTIKDIARLCGVSVSTVSRVLNNHPDVSDDVRRRVMDTIEEQSYIPNNSARNLVLTNTDTIALLVRGFSNPFFTRIIRGVEQEIYRRGYSMVLHQISSDDDEIVTAAMLAKEKRLCGILLLGGRFNYSPEETARLTIPYVCCTYTNTFGSLDPTSYSSVAINDKKEACGAVTRLIQSGHRRIAALVAETDDHSISELRFSGYRQALEESGIPLDMSLVKSIGGFNMDDAYEGMRELMESGNRFTAVFTIADAMAIAAIKALFDHGRRVPDDCSVISIDGLELSNYTIPTLTTLEQPVDTIAAESTDILIGLIEGRGGNRHVVLGTALRPGSSVKDITK